MFSFLFLLSTIACLLVATVGILLAVAFLVAFERKLMASVQRRLGPNVVGFWGLGQSVADGLKLFAKEFVLPRMANPFLFVFAPQLPFIFGVAATSLLPLNIAGAFANPDIGLLLNFALTSLGVYGIIWGGFASNSKYAFLGSIRATAQMISYEVSLGLILLPIILLAGETNIYAIALEGSGLWFVFGFFPSAILYLISLLAETNRAPFDLPEAEGELVSGYNIDFSAIAFALFFLAEYTNMLAGACLYTCIFLGGIGFINSQTPIHGVFIAIQVGLLMAIYVWSRATLPRFHFAELMAFCWTVILPLSFGLLVFYAGYFFCLNQL